MAEAPVLELKGDLQTKTPILTYHDIIEARDSKSVWFDCTLHEFMQQLNWLTERGATFVSIEQVHRHLTGVEPLPEKAVCITFADNYLGFYRLGLPELRKRGIPVAMFVHTGYVGSSQGRPKMDWDQLKELSAEGLVTIGSQTISHPADLTKLDDQQLAKELEDSKAKLEEELGRPAWALAYPNGKWNSRVADFARTAGYRIAFSEVQKPSEQSESIYSVNRYVHTKYQQAWRDAYGW